MRIAHFNLLNIDRPKHARLFVGEIVAAGDIFVDRKHKSLTTMDTDVPPMVLIYQQALNTFDDDLLTDITDNFNELKSLVDTLKAEDLKFDLRHINPEIWKKPGKAPCTFMEVFQNSILSMTISVLKPGFKIPLHNHPQMHGLLKVISGKMRIKSYSVVPLREMQSCEEGAAHGGASTTNKIYAKISQDIECTASSQTCVLTPSISNYHEIEALNEPLAFFNILAQPYESPPRQSINQGICVRCKYHYIIENQMANAVVELKEQKKPDWFFYDRADYSGPGMLSFGPYF